MRQIRWNWKKSPLYGDLISSANTRYVKSKLLKYSRRPPARYTNDIQARLHYTRSVVGSKLSLEWGVVWWGLNQGGSREYCPRNILCFRSLGRAFSVFLRGMFIRVSCIQKFKILYNRFCARFCHFLQLYPSSFETKFGLYAPQAWMNWFCSPIDIYTISMKQQTVTDKLIVIAWEINKQSVKKYIIHMSEKIIAVNKTKGAIRSAYKKRKHQPPNKCL